MYYFKIKGTVQGVGFRPYIYNECVKHGLVGTVKNTGDGVEILVNNHHALKDILNSVPPLAKIESVVVQKIIDDKHYPDFKIIESKDVQGESLTPPDVCICDECLHEMLKDTNNSRHQYYFNTCTNCGPRFTITAKTPYDRKNTSMNDFKMCPSCNQDYSNPSDRRYHAQTTCCHQCGPELKLYLNKNQLTNDRIISRTVEMLKAGEIVAIKGIGGFHLCCNTKPNTIKKLKKIRARGNKPFALMVPNINMAKLLAKISPKEEELLQSKERPIVLLEKFHPNLFKDISQLSTIGIMLPYTGLHYLIFQNFNEPLIVTSSNHKDHPITTEKEDQFVSTILSNPKKILNPLDDSVIKVINEQPLQIRRSRGYVPNTLEIPNENNHHLIALGAEENNTACFYKNNKAILSEYFGNLNGEKNFERFKKGVSRWIDFIGLNPNAILCDMHPDFNTTKYGKELSDKFEIPLIQIQHHEAHVMSAAVENNLKEFVGIAFDGTGYGRDGTIWGGEIFIGRNNRLKRVGTLEQHKMIGAELAINEPLRMVISILSKFMGKDEIYPLLHNFYPENNYNLIYSQLEQNFNCVDTSSCGRILDAASALLGICAKRTYSGEPAMMLESAGTSHQFELEPEIIQDNGLMKLQTTPLFKFLVSNLDKPHSQLAGFAHDYISNGVLKMIDIIQNQQGPLPVVFSGGVAYNKFITSKLLQRGVHINKQIPAGDGGISFGQIATYLFENKDKQDTPIFGI